MTITALPSAHLATHKNDGYTARNETGTTYSMQPLPISHQPVAAKQMSLSTSNEERNRGEQTVDGPLRLKGGCIPCPDGSRCYIIPIPCCC